MATTAPAMLKFLSLQELQERCVARLWAGKELSCLYGWACFAGPEF